MGNNPVQDAVDRLWETSVIPALKKYISIPAVSPEFAPDWETEGHLLDALKIAEQWCRAQAPENARIRILKPPGRTPLLLIDIPPLGNSVLDTVLFYGHLDKQPATEGWDGNKGPWSPVVENERLYGRGSVDDGYAVFAAVSAIKALEVNHIPHGRCVILIETCEESGSLDLDYYLEACADTIGRPDLVICLDSGINDYERLWLTASLRGFVAGRLTVSLLTHGIHSGASGRAASSFRIMRELLDRIEDSRTGEVLIRDFHAPIPEKRLEQIRETARICGDDLAAALPLVEGGRPMADNPTDLIVNSSWKSMLSYTGAEGFPKLSAAGNVLRPCTSLLLSMRTPPTVDTRVAAKRLKTVLEQSPPWGAKVSFDHIGHSKGWDMPPLGDRLLNRVTLAAQSVFGHAPAYVCEGGTIPLMTLLTDRFPRAKFIVTGALGPHGNAHGPNEFLHIPYVKKLTYAVALMISGE